MMRSGPLRLDARFDWFFIMTKTNEKLDAKILLSYLSVTRLGWRDAHHLSTEVEANPEHTLRLQASAIGNVTTRLASRWQREPGLLS